MIKMRLESLYRTIISSGTFDLMIYHTIIRNLQSIDLGKNDVIIEELKAVDSLEPTNNFKILNDIINIINYNNYSFEHFKPWILLTY